MVNAGSKFFIEFSLPDRVMKASNDVDLSVAYFAGWKCSSSKMNILVNDRELVHHDECKSEDKGRTVTKRNIPFDWLNLHGSGKTNKI